MSAKPRSDSESALLTVSEVHAELERLLRSRNYMGFRNLLGDALLEPRNPFQRVRRCPKQWIVLAVMLFAFAFVILYFFRLR